MYCQAFCVSTVASGLGCSLAAHSNSWFCVDSDPALRTVMRNALRRLHPDPSTSVKKASVNKLRLHYIGTIAGMDMLLSKRLAADIDMNHYFLGSHKGSVCATWVSPKSRLAVSLCR
jgi:hypothetical protein